MMGAKRGGKRKIPTADQQSVQAEEKRKRTAETESKELADQDQPSGSTQHLDVKDNEESGDGLKTNQIDSSSTNCVHEAGKNSDLSALIETTQNPENGGKEIPPTCAHNTKHLDEGVSAAKRNICEPQFKSVTEEGNDICSGWNINANDEKSTEMRPLSENDHDENHGGRPIYEDSRDPTYACQEANNPAVAEKITEKTDKNYSGADKKLNGNEDIPVGGNQSINSRGELSQICVPSAVGADEHRDALCEHNNETDSNFFLPTLNNSSKLDASLNNQRSGVGDNLKDLCRTSGVKHYQDIPLNKNSRAVCEYLPENVANTLKDRIIKTAGSIKEILTDEGDGRADNDIESRQASWKTTLRKEELELEYAEEEASFEDGTDFERDVTESQLCALSDDILEQEKGVDSEAMETRRRQQEDGEKTVQAILESLIKLNHLVSKTRLEMERIRQRLQQSSRGFQAHAEL